MTRWISFFLIAGAAAAQICQTVAVAGHPSSGSPFPSPSTRFSVNARQLAVTPGGELLFAAPTQILKVDGVLVNPWAPAFYASSVSWQSLVSAPDGSLLTTVGNQVLRLLSDGTSEVLAGTTQAGYAGDGGPAVEALLNAPSALALLPDGSLLVADNGNFRIRRITVRSSSPPVRGPRPRARALTINTIAGNGGGDPTIGEGGPAIRARIGNVLSLTALPDGSVYFAEGSQYGGAPRLREITTQGNLVTVAANANGTANATNDNVPLPSASFTSFTLLATGPDGLLYILDGATLRYLEGGALHIVRIHPKGQYHRTSRSRPTGAIIFWLNRRSSTGSPAAARVWRWETIRPRRLMECPPWTFRSYLPVRLWVPTACCISSIPAAMRSCASRPTALYRRPFSKRVPTRTTTCSSHGSSRSMPRAISSSQAAAFFTGENRMVR
jgi:hypothetical protein